jgi:hypothetical protein
MIASYLPQETGFLGKVNHEVEILCPNPVSTERDRVLKPGFLERLLTKSRFSCSNPVSQNAVSWGHSLWLFLCAHKDMSPHLPTLCRIFFGNVFFFFGGEQKKTKKRRDRVSRYSDKMRFLAKIELIFQQQSLQLWRL